MNNEKVIEIAELLEENKTLLKENILLKAKIKKLDSELHPDKFKIYCKNCNELFTPKRSIEIYCENCRYVGYINKIKNNEFLKAYNTAYKSKHAQKQRITHGKGEDVKNIYSEALKKWRNEAKVKLELVQSGVISEKEFIDYLKSNLEV